MASDLFFRTEDLRPEEVFDYFVETSVDRIAIDAIKGRSPVVLRGSRGVGKSFLLRMAEAELKRDLASLRILPVYVTFAQAMLIQGPSPEKFMSWMIAKICARLARAATTQGLDLSSGSAIVALRGGDKVAPSRMESLEAYFEEAWKGAQEPSSLETPGPELLKDAVQELCKIGGFKRVALLVDEAAHVFIPEQQRQFFTLMRDLRSPYLSVKAAVYPGVTAFGPSFQPTHDATMISVDRSVMEPGYSVAMRDVVLKQDDKLKRAITQYGEAFDTLSYAATGNPRILLKTLSRSTNFNTRTVAQAIREYYREEIWAEHSGLADRYPGHRKLIDWGREFIEDQVLPDIFKRNQGRASGTSSYLWIHRDAPHPVREALRLLCYSGILQEGDSGIKATRSQIGTRYMVNLGCQIALSSDPISYGTQIRKSLSVKRMIEYGANHLSYASIADMLTDDLSSGDNAALEARLSAPSDVLDVTRWQLARLKEISLLTIGDVLRADESVFTKAHGVGPAKARKMSDAAGAAVFEYLSG